MPETAPNYAEAGLRVGLEIHQQLEGSKLFCRCPTRIKKDAPDFSFTRRLRASAGEVGRVDAAALAEQAKGKRFVYHAFGDATCLVELDEEPPHAADAGALAAALQLCALLHLAVPDQLQVMRKVVIDGSNVSGFQRTMLVGRNGWLELDGKRVSVPTLCLEEEAAQIVERTASKDTYNLSRLGIPLLEIATGPDLTTPQEVRAAAAKLGELLRALPNCKRGLGSIRQDVNLSVRGGPRVEIKGFQDLRSIPRVIEFEAARQLRELKAGTPMAPHVRKAEADFSTSFLRPMPGADRMYPETDVPPFAPPAPGVVRLRTVEERVREYVAAGLSEDVAAQIVRAEGLRGESFAQILGAYPRVDKGLVAFLFVQVPKDLKRRENLDFDPWERHADILGPMQRGEIVAGKDVALELAKSAARGKPLEATRFAAVDLAQVEADIAQLVGAHPGKNQGVLMGLAMQKWRGKVDGKVVAKLVEKHAK